MRRLGVFLVSGCLMVGCGSRQRRACERVADFQMEEMAQFGKKDGDRKKMVTSCLELREKMGATKKEWDGFLGCVEAGTKWGDMESCVIELGFEVGKRRNAK